MKLERTTEGIDDQIPAKQAVRWGVDRRQKPEHPAISAGFRLLHAHEPLRRPNGRLPWPRSPVPHPSGFSVDYLKADRRFPGRPTSPGDMPPSGSEPRKAWQTLPVRSLVRRAHGKTASTCLLWRRLVVN